MQVTSQRKSQGTLKGTRKWSTTEVSKGLNRGDLVRCGDSEGRAVLFRTQKARRSPWQGREKCPVFSVGAQGRA